MLTLCSMVSCTYYARFNAGIISSPLAEDLYSYEATLRVIELHVVISSWSRKSPGKLVRNMEALKI